MIATSLSIMFEEMMLVTVIIVSTQGYKYDDIDY